MNLRSTPINKSGTCESVALGRPRAIGASLMCISGESSSFFLP